MTPGRRLRQGAGGLVAAAIGFGLVLSFSFIAGRYLLPGDDRYAIPTTTAPAEPGMPSFDELRAGIGEDDYGASAAFAAEGALEGRFILNLVDWRDWMAGGVADGPSVDLDMRYYSGHSDDDPVLILGASGLAVGDVRTARYTVIVVSGARTFTAKDGQCRLELLSLGYDTLPPAFGPVDNGDRTMPRFAGQIECADVPELRTDATMSFVAAFDYDPKEYEG